MNLTEEILNEVEEMGSLFVNPVFVAINIGLSADETETFIIGVQINQTDSKLVSSYITGWLKTDIALRKAIKQSAMNGSSPSQQAMLNYQREGRVWD